MAHIDLAYSRLPPTVRVTSQFPWPPPPSPVRSDRLWRSNIWPTREAIQRWFYTWDSYSVLFSSLQRETENERKLVTPKGGGNKRTWKLESVLLFFLCVPVSSTLKDVCLFCQSAETSVYLFLSTSVCLCASGGSSEDGGLRVACLGASRDTWVICRDVCKG